MNQRVYLETTIPSYLTARPSRDIVRAAEQEVTRAWWASRDRFDVYVSDLVVKEVAAGDPDAAVQRIQSLAGITVLELTAEAQRLGYGIGEKNGITGQIRDRCIAYRDCRRSRNRVFTHMELQAYCQRDDA